MNIGRLEGNHNCRIKCKETTFLAALMWRGQANRVTLATATHRKVGWMSNGTGTQVKVQMINKCKTLITLRRLYKRRASHEEGIKKSHKKERKTIAFNQEHRCTHTFPRTEHPVDIKEIFLRSTAAWPKIN